MNNIFLKNAVMAISLLSAAGYTGVVSAHSQAGTLGLRVGATDLYQVTCYDDGEGAGAPKLLATSVVTGVAPADLKVSVRTQRLTKATNTTDPVNGDGVGSPFVYTIAGSGVYYMTVGKTAAHTVQVPYTINFHCLSSTDGHAGTSWTILQNQ